MSWDLSNVLEDELHFKSIVGVKIYPPKLIQAAATCIMNADTALTKKQRGMLRSVAFGRFKYDNVTSQVIPMIQRRVRNYGKVDAVAFDVMSGSGSLSLFYSKDEKTLWYTFE